MGWLDILLLLPIAAWLLSSMFLITKRKKFHY